MYEVIHVKDNGLRETFLFSVYFVCLISSAWCDHCTSLKRIIWYSISRHSPGDTIKCNNISNSLFRQRACCS